jgi:histidine ammonia-lyase
MTNPLRIHLKNQLTLETLDAYAKGKIEAVELSQDDSFGQWIETNHQFLLRRVNEGWPVYGATTGFGASSASRMSLSETGSLQQNLFRYHGCGIGPNFEEAELAAILLVRLNCLTQGASGVSFELLERLQLMLDRRIFPVIPQRGSVGASGDLTPLSYIAAALAGEREVLWNGRILAAKDLWSELGQEPYRFKTREALSIMNGTSVMTAVAGLAWVRLHKLFELTAMASAAMVELWQGPCAPFLPELHRVKPHRGQSEAAAEVLSYLYEPNLRLQHRDPRSAEAVTQGAVQDPYSIRCVPQVLGAFKDALNCTRVWIETEMNSVNDNPVFLHEENLILNGGHFMGQHMTMACDMLKASTANVVNLLDRQMALLLESRGRLPDNLVSPKVASNLNHGFKAMQITMSSLASEVAKMATPMSVFSRPTESSNQDVVSMGTTAARDLLSISEIAMDALAIHLMAIRQAFYIADENAATKPKTNHKLSQGLARLSETFPKLMDDRALDREIVATRRLLFEAGL